MSKIILYFIAINIHAQKNYSDEEAWSMWITLELYEHFQFLEAIELQITDWETKKIQNDKVYSTLMMIFKTSTMF